MTSVNNTAMLYVAIPCSLSTGANDNDGRMLFPVTTASAPSRGPPHPPPSDAAAATNADSMVMTFRCHSQYAKLPTRGSLSAAGLDLYAAECTTIPAGCNGMVTTGISISQFPQGCYGRLAARSGMALHRSIVVGAGVIDPDYTGIIKVVLFNLGKKPLDVTIGDRIAQLVCERFLQPVIQQDFGPPSSSLSLPPLATTTTTAALATDDGSGMAGGNGNSSLTGKLRGTNGFGSTGR